MLEPGRHFVTAVAIFLRELFTFVHCGDIFVLIVDRGDIFDCWVDIFMLTFDLFVICRA